MILSCKLVASLSDLVTQVESNFEVTFQANIIIPSYALENQAPYFENGLQLKYFIVLKPDSENDIESFHTIKLGIIVDEKVYKVQ